MTWAVLKEFGSVRQVHNHSRPHCKQEKTASGKSCRQVGGQQLEGTVAGEHTAGRIKLHHIISRKHPPLYTSSSSDLLSLVLQMLGRSFFLVLFLLFTSWSWVLPISTPRPFINHHPRPSTNQPTCYRTNHISALRPLTSPILGNEQTSLVLAQWLG